MGERLVRRRRWILAALVVAVALWASLHELGQIHDALRDAHPTRDNAIYEINVRRVLAGEQWSGPHSQGFRHPGPSFFYLLALPYALAGKTTFSLYAGAQLLTVLFVLGSALVVSWLPKSPAPALLFVPVLLLEMAYLGDYPLYDFWPPYVLFFAYGLFLLLCASLAAGKTSVLAPLIVTATLLVQTHVSYAPATLAGLGLTSLYWIRPEAPVPRGAARHLLWAALCGAVLWAHPMYAEVVNGVGNLRSIHHVFVETDPMRWPLSRLVDRASLEFSGPWQFALFRDRFIVPEDPKHYGAARWIAMVELGALVLGWWRARRRAERFGEALCALCVVSVFVAAWSIGNIRFDPAPHHTAWISILGFVAPLAAAAGLRAPASGAERRPLVRMLGIVSAWAASVFLWPIRVIPGVHTNPEVAQLATAVVEGLREEGRERPLITWESAAEYDWAVAVLLELEKRRVPFFVEENAALRWMIGAPRWETPGDSTTVVTFTVAASEEEGRKLACAERGDDYFMRYPVCVWLKIE